MDLSKEQLELFSKVFHELGFDKSTLEIKEIDNGISDIHIILRFVLTKEK